MMAVAIERHGCALRRKKCTERTETPNVLSSPAFAKERFPYLVLSVLLVLENKKTNATLAHLNTRKLWILKQVSTKQAISAVASCNSTLFSVVSFQQLDTHFTQTYLGFGCNRLTGGIFAKLTHTKDRKFLNQQFARSQRPSKTLEGKNISVKTAIPKVGPQTKIKMAIVYWRTAEILCRIFHFSSPYWLRGSAKITW